MAAGALCVCALLFYFLSALNKGTSACDICSTLLSCALRLLAYSAELKEIDIDGTTIFVLRIVSEFVLVTHKMLQLDKVSVCIMSGPVSQTKRTVSVASIEFTKLV